MDILNIQIQKTKWEKAQDIFRVLFRGIIILFFLVLIGGTFEAAQYETKEYVQDAVDWYGNILPFDPNQKHVAIIPIQGMIFNESMAQLEQGTTSETVLRMLNDARNDSNIQAIILEIDSPGGTVLDSEIIAEEVVQTKKVKPVYALLKSTAASGGYYIASQADKIFAYRDTITGSIGVILQIPNAKKLMDKVGVEMIDITSGNMKSMGSPYHELNNESRAVFQTLADESYAAFVERVASGRSLEKDAVKKLADGRIYSGSQALALQLIDSIEGKTGLQKELESKGLGTAQLLYFSLPKSPLEEIFGPLGMGVKSLFMKSGNPLLLYHL